MGGVGAPGRRRGGHHPLSSSKSRISPLLDTPWNSVDREGLDLRGRSWRACSLLVRMAGACIRSSDGRSGLGRRRDFALRAEARLPVRPSPGVPFSPRATCPAPSLADEWAPPGCRMHPWGLKLIACGVERGLSSSSRLAPVPGPCQCGLLQEAPTSPRNLGHSDGSQPWVVSTRCSQPLRRFCVFTGVTGRNSTGATRMRMQSSLHAQHGFYRWNAHGWMGGAHLPPQGQSTWDGHVAPQRSSLE